MRKVLMTICLLIILVVGCTEEMSQDFFNPGWRQRHTKAKIYVEQNPQLSQRIKNCILNEQIRIGMTKEQVLLSWGRPCEYGSCINKTVGSWGVHEQWVYSSRYGPYLYFENGVLTSWQK